MAKFQKGGKGKGVKNPKGARLAAMVKKARGAQAQGC